MQNEKIDLLTLLNDTSTRLFSCNVNESTEKQLYKTVCTVLREMLAKKRKHFKKDFSGKEKKQVYYMSMEFLVGTSLRNNLYNIGLEEEFRSVLAEQGFDLDALYELTPMQDLVTAVWEDLLPAIWIPLRGSVCPLPVFQSGMSLEYSSRR